MSDKMARSAVSRTDSDSAFSASMVIPSVAQVTRLAIRPMARSTARRRYDSTSARTSGLAGPSVGRPLGHLVAAPTR